jgi:hypothetical protein
MTAMTVVTVITRDLRSLRLLRALRARERHGPSHQPARVPPSFRRCFPQPFPLRGWISVDVWGVCVPYFEIRRAALDVVGGRRQDFVKRGSLVVALYSHT